MYLPARAFNSGSAAMRPVAKCGQRARPPTGRSECLLARISSQSHMKAHGRPRPAARGGFDRWNLDLAPPSATTRTGLLARVRPLSARPDRPKRTRPTHCAWILHALRFAGAGTYRPRWPALPRKGLARQILVSPPKARRRPSRGAAGQKPIGLCHPGPNEEPTHDTARLQPPEIISSFSPAVSLHTAT